MFMTDDREVETSSNATRQEGAVFFLALAYANGKGQSVTFGGRPTLGSRTRFRPARSHARPDGTHQVVQHLTKATVPPRFGK